MDNTLPFLQIFPAMFQENNVAETFRIRLKKRNKSLTQNTLDQKKINTQYHCTE